jgi:hypothetical protein
VYPSLSTLIARFLPSENLLPTQVTFRLAINLKGAFPNSFAKEVSMLQSLENIRNYKIHAKNGDIGHVEDFYFDDKDWKTCYLVADYGNWVTGHQKVLITPQHFVHTDWTEGKLYVDLTTEQVESSPDASAHTPISRQHKMSKAFASGFKDKDVDAVVAQKISPEDMYLCSLKDTEGLHIEAADGEIGHVLDFMVNEETWEIVWLVASTRNWWPGKQVLISPEHIKRVSWPERKIYLDMTRQEVKASHI